MRTGVCWEITFLRAEEMAIIFSHGQEIGAIEMTEDLMQAPIENAKQRPENPDRPWPTPK